MNKDHRNKFEGLLDSEFEERLLHASFESLTAKENPLRFNNFACSIRELSRHMLHRMGPDEKVLSCSWYKSPDPEKPKLITRNHRMAYAIHGGFQDKYLLEHYELDIAKAKKGILDSIELLNKYTHINDDTFDMPQEEIDFHVNEISNAFLNLFEEIQNCRKQLCDLIDDEIDKEIFAHAILEVNEDIDLMSTHHVIESTSISHFKVIDITEDKIFFRAAGVIDVEQQFGSRSDLRNDIGAIINTSFPFSSVLSARIEFLPKIENNLEILSFDVDVHGELTEEEINRMEEEHFIELGLYNEVLSEEE
ncbi:MAG TPA: hypothetical protein VN763_03710, partial [Saprospiraceae bacterium]|nr:hypothetical protein [Saprospiraceae bacterium]